jgi:hypothetical protein
LINISTQTSVAQSGAAKPAKQVSGVLFYRTAHTSARTVREKHVNGAIPSLFLPSQQKVKQGHTRRREGGPGHVRTSVVHPAGMSSSAQRARSLFSSSATSVVTHAVCTCHLPEHYDTLARAQAPALPVSCRVSRCVLCDRCCVPCLSVLQGVPGCPSSSLPPSLITDVCTSALTALAPHLSTPSLTTPPPRTALCSERPWMVAELCVFRTSWRG